jgi:hypothetical protein
MNGITQYALKIKMNKMRIRGYWLLAKDLSCVMKHKTHLPRKMIKRRNILCKKKRKKKKEKQERKKEEKTNTAMSYDKGQQKNKEKEKRKKKERKIQKSVVWWWIQTNKLNALIDQVMINLLAAAKNSPKPILSSLLFLCTSTYCRSYTSSRVAVC